MAATLLCDISPTPVECWAQRKIASGYSGHAIDVFNPYSGAAGNIGFLADGALDESALDAVLNSGIGLTINWKGQRNGCDLSSSVITRIGILTNGSKQVEIDTTGIPAKIDIMGAGVPEGTIAATIDSPTQLSMNYAATADGPVSLTFSQSPNIQQLQVGNSRSLEFQGINHSGAIFGLTSCDITTLGVTAKDFTMLFVLRPYSSMTINQASGFDPSAIIDLQGSGGTVAQVLNDPNSGIMGGWRVRDGASLNFLSEMPVQTGDVVLVISSSSSENVVRVWQNGKLRATSTISGLTRTAATAYIGKLMSSSPGGSSNAGGMGLVAAVIWNVGLSDLEVSRVGSAAALEFGIDLGTGNYKTNALYLMGDSIPAGYVTFGLFGMANYLQALTTYPVWMGNYSIPGSTLTDPGGGCAWTACLYGIAVAPEISAPTTTLSRIVLLLAGGNDSGLGPTTACYSPVNICGGGITDGSTNVITGITDTTPLSIGDFVYAPNIAVLCKISSKTATSITIILDSNGLPCIPSSAAAVNLQYTAAAVTPALIANTLQSLADQAIADGATSVVISTILPRDVIYQPWISASNVLIRTITGHTICDLAADPQLSVNPSANYADASHLSEAGQSRAAVVWAGCVNPLLTAPRRRRVTVRFAHGRLRSHLAGFSNASCRIRHRPSHRRAA